MMIQDAKEYTKRINQICTNLSSHIQSSKGIEQLIELNELMKEILTLNRVNIKAYDRLLVEERVKPYLELDRCLDGLKIPHNGVTKSFNDWFYIKYKGLPRVNYWK